MYSYYSFTTTFNLAILRYPAEGSYPQLDVPLHVLTMTVPSATFDLVPLTGIAVYDPLRNNAVSVSLPAQSPSQLPKLSLQGYVETPSTGPDGSGNYTSSVTRDGYAMSYGDIVTANMEGRGNADTSFDAIHPTLFRDGFGRQFDFPRVIDCTFEYVANRPFRQNFTIQLQLTRRVTLNAT